MRLLQAIDTYLRRHNMAQTRFGRLAVNDPRLVIDLRKGRALRPRTAARVEAFLRSEEGEA